MDLKWGEVLVKKGRLNKKSKKWLVLVSKTEDAPAQLEAFDSEEQYLKHREHAEKLEKNKNDKRKVYSMENLQEDDIDKVAKKSTKEFYIDLPLKKEKITLILESGDHVDDWHSSIVRALTAEAGCDGLRDNILYQSREKTLAPTFNVMIEPTDASKRMNLSGLYTLLVTPSALLLEDKESKEFKCNWAYEFIRRYGYEKKTGAFTIEAGRRCATGEGKFVLSGKDSASISTAIDQQVSRTAKNAAQTSSITARLGISLDQEEKRKSVTPPGQRKSAPLSVSLGHDENSHKMERDSRTSLKTQTNIPSQLTPEFKQELEEHMANPPPSPEPKETKGKEKEKTKSKFTLFRKADKKKSTERKSEREESSTASEEGERREEPLYDEAVVSQENNKPVAQKGALYEEATKTRENAWKNMGQSEKVHEEDYNKIKKAAKENEGKNIVVTQPTDDDDEMYDRVDLNVNEAQQKVALKNMGESKHIYGVASAKALCEIPDEEDYATPDFKSGGPTQENDYEFDDEEEDPYDDTASCINDTEQTEYTDAISVQQKPPIAQKPPITDKPIPQRRAKRPALYEEVQ